MFVGVLGRRGSARGRRGWGVVVCQRRSRALPRHRPPGPLRALDFKSELCAFPRVLPRLRRITESPQNCTLADRALTGKSHCSARADLLWRNDSAPQEKRALQHRAHRGGTFCRHMLTLSMTKRENVRSKRCPPRWVTLRTPAGCLCAAVAVATCYPTIAALCWPCGYATRLLPSAPRWLLLYAVPPLGDTPLAPELSTNAHSAVDFGTSGRQAAGSLISITEVPPMALP
ncbi:hypothetical protein DFH94DRAFT_348702 [Russula ochroleuca]|jgi:hypothetical protein|uniref:Uncharacterized protein n=1 Tax=Russula ochroleuca TaxID=152965 RepID=A0A9P5JV92_9AGAM|nr:hypothetical protein DFH94DRAFT_348702 [Russula ochroleuca]